MKIVGDASAAQPAAVCGCRRCLPKRRKAVMRLCCIAVRLSSDTSFGSPDAPACAVPVKAVSRLVPFRLRAGQGFLGCHCD